MVMLSPRGVAEELDMELQALEREMARALRVCPADDATHSAVRRELRGQRESAVRLRALFADKKMVA